jgi:flagella basal body P-ring formation protein FlgA
VNDRVVRTLTVPFRLKVYGNAVVAKKNLKRGQILTEDLLEVRRVDLSGIRGRVFKDIQDLISWQTKIALKAGIPITDRQVKVVPLIKRGDKVSLKIESDCFSLVTYAKACESGKKGDVIRVMNLKTRKVIKATVVDVGLVKVKL